MKEQKHSYSQRIGKTTFIVNVKQSESAKKPLNTVFQGGLAHPAADLEDLRTRFDELISIGKQILSRLADL